MQALPEPPESLCIVEMGGTEAKEETGEVGSVGGLFLNIGLQVRDVLGVQPTKHESVKNMAIYSYIDISKK